jgi:hypothetical protein
MRFNPNIFKPPKTAILLACLVLLASPTLAQTINLQPYTACGLDSCVINVDMGKLVSASDVTTLKSVDLKTKASSLPKEVSDLRASWKSDNLTITANIKAGSSSYFTINYNGIVLDPWFNSSLPFVFNYSLRSSVSANTLIIRNFTLNTYQLIQNGNISSDCTTGIALTNESDLVVPFWLEGLCGNTTAQTNSSFRFLTTTKADNSSVLKVYFGNPSGNINYQNKNAVFSGYSVFYPMSEGSGATANDGSINNNALNLNGGYSWTRGIIGNGTAFNGANGYGISASSLPNDTAVTISVWAYIINQSAALNGLFLKGDAVGSRQIGLLRYNAVPCANLIETIIYAPIEINSCSQVYPTGAWTLFTGRFNGTYTDMFVNGTLITSVLTAAMTPYTTKLVLAEHVGGSTAYTGGYYDDAFYMSTPMSNNQIKLYYDSITNPSLFGAQSDTQTFTKNATSVALYLNGNQSNISLPYGTLLNSTAVLNITTSYGLKLIINNTIANSTNNIVYNISNLSVGLWNISGVYDSTPNELASYKTYWANITNTTTPVIPPASNNTIAYVYCTANTTLGHINITNLQTDGVITYYENCPYGCDNVTKICSPPLYQTNLIVLAIIFIFIAILYKVYKWL